MYIYCGKKILNPICIHFLCGCKYDKNDENDKRNVVAKYIDSLENNYSLILERQFTFRHYKKMNLKDLGEVELFASHYASTIIILHETNSTAAEIALFGSVKGLQNKILVIYPPKSLIEINNIGTFLDKAYFDINKAKKIPYNDFSISLNSENEHVRYFETNFNDNILDDKIKEIINRHIYNNRVEVDLSFNKKSKYIINNYYLINRNNKLVSISLDYNFIFSFILSIICNKAFQKQIRNVNDCVKEISFLMKNILSNTVSDNEKLDLSSSWSVNIKTIDNKNIDKPIKFCVNLLVGIGLLKFESGNIVFSRNIKNLSDYGNLIQKKETKDFFGNMNIGDNYE